MSTLTERMSRRTIKPCTSCDGEEFYGGNVGLEHTTGSRGHYFDLVICRRCGRTEMFVDGPPERWVERRSEDHEFVEFQISDRGQGPYR